MPKKKMNAKKKVVSSKTPSIVSQKKADKCCSSWIWWVLGVLVLLAALFFLYKGMTGNAITGYVPVAIENTWSDYLKPVLEYVFGWQMENGSDTIKFNDYFTMALLIFVIVFSVVFVVVKSIPFFNNREYSWVSWVITIAISLLSIRFLTAGWLITILLPYSTLGVAISAGLPFILFFFVVRQFKSKFAKRLAWIFFAVIFLYMWLSMPTLTLSSYGTGAQNSTGPFYGIYGWTALIAICMALFGQSLVESIETKIGAEKKENAVRRKGLMNQAENIRREVDYYQAQLDSAKPGTSSYTTLEGKINALNEKLGKVYAEVDKLE